MSGVALHVEGLSVRFGEQRVLEEVNLSAERHAITALMGPSGCGKTSFLLCINRLCDHASGCAVSGRVRAEGEDVLAPGTDLLRLRRKVGMIFQRPTPFPLSIRRNLELPLREHGVRSRAALDEAMETALRECRLVGRGEGPARNAGAGALRRSASALAHRARHRAQTRRCC